MNGNGTSASPPNSRAVHYKTDYDAVDLEEKPYHSTDRLSYIDDADSVDGDPTAQLPSRKIASK